jgi:hypothetical protein
MITKAIKNCLSQAALKGWNKTYWTFDIHGTILRPTYKTSVLSTEFYPHAKEVLQLLSKRDDIVRIIFTCSYPEEILAYVKYFSEHDIHFNYINENPEVCAGAYGHYECKFYFNVLFEDKAGFDPMTDWADVFNLLTNTTFNTI